MSVQSYRDLEVWQRVMDLAEQCYLATRGFPKEEWFGLRSQLRRAATSIPANIPEGQGRDSTKDFMHFLSIARGSLMELETHVLLCQRVGLLEPANADPLLELSDRVSRMLSRLRAALQRNLDANTHPS
jgi:four helix bundle protein